MQSGQACSSSARVALRTRVTRTPPPSPPPGWGHASENPALPQALEANGITFVGPTDKAMFLLGDKIASTIIAESAGVPCVSWSGAEPSPPARRPSPAHALTRPRTGERGRVEQAACASAFEPADGCASCRHGCSGGAGRLGARHRAGRQVRRGVRHLRRASRRGCGAGRLPNHDQGVGGRRREGAPRTSPPCPSPRLPPPLPLRPPLPPSPSLSLSSLSSLSLAPPSLSLAPPRLLPRPTLASSSAFDALLSSPSAPADPPTARLRPALSASPALTPRLPRLRACGWPPRRSRSRPCTRPSATRSRDRPSS